MLVFSHEKTFEELRESFEQQEFDWDYELSFREDEDFVYMDIESEEDVVDEVFQYGGEVGARNTAEINDGEKYTVAFEK